MKLLKNYFNAWNTSRIIRAILAASLFAAYYFDKETLFLFAGIILGLQAIFNISCPGGSCTTVSDKNAKPLIHVEKYEPNKK
ncbi:MAG: hypothetical protein QM800_15635 [Paludibacter sp.]